MLLLSYIYGIVYPIEEILAVCAEKGILVVEDIAESYKGNDYIGHNKAIMSLFSFGSIKRSTSFTGALAFVRDKPIYLKMAAIHEGFKIQKRSEFFQKILKVAAMGLLLNNQSANLSVKKLSRRINFDYKEFVVKTLRYR